VTPQQEALIAALRSDRYVQGRDQLRSPDVDGKPCCCILGVACDVSGLGKWEKRPGESWAYWLDGRLSCVAAAPLSVHLHFRLPPSLASLNDGGMSFGELADYLEAIWTNPSNKKDLSS